jgi:hypothetical protein
VKCDYVFVFIGQMAGETKKFGDIDMKGATPPVDFSSDTFLQGVIPDIQTYLEKRLASNSCSLHLVLDNTYQK